ncbi:YfbM family protein [Kribbella sp. NPDC023855]|uniref:YfbM family protein n=1 Tax=Kribbella sp. NPDC023855 TaxID=3154698 RepID=UPI0033EB9498
MSMIWEGRSLTAAEADGLKADPELLEELVEEEGEAPLVADLDKAWHGLHWVLTGAAWRTEAPLAQAIMGGEEFGEDWGYGRPRLLDPTGVAAVATALGSIEADDLRARFDPDAMSAAELYPDVWDEEGIFDSYLLPYFEELKALYAHAAAEGRWMLQTLT